jgi:hypothetical protein
VTLARGCGRAGHVADAIEDSRDTCPGRGTHTWCDTHGGLVVKSRKPTQLRWRVPMGNRGDTGRHHEWCIKAKQLHMERVVVRSKL